MTFLSVWPGMTHKAACIEAPVGNAKGADGGRLHLNLQRLWDLSGDCQRVLPPAVGLNTARDEAVATQDLPGAAHNRQR